MPEQRTVLVPDGLDGERLDAAMARLFGLSRTKAVALIADGQVRLDGVVAGKSSRVIAGVLLEAALPTPDEAPKVQSRVEPIPGMAIIHEDDDLIVVDKPVGVAAHPSVGWDGPDVLGGLQAAGIRIAT